MVLSFLTSECVTATGNSVSTIPDIVLGVCYWAQWCCNAGLAIQTEGCRPALSRKSPPSNLVFFGFWAFSLCFLTLEDGMTGCPETSVTDNLRCVKSQKYGCNHALYYLPVKPAALNRCGAMQRSRLLGVLLKHNVQCQTNNTVRQLTGEAVNKTLRHTVIRLDL
jgi:hypothetical protein